MCGHKDLTAALFTRALMGQKKKAKMEKVKPTIIMLMFRMNYFNVLITGVQTYPNNHIILNLLIWYLGGVVLSKKYSRHQRQTD